ncbi:MAG: hypothetical protein GTO41_06625, partial [Burkholderiales bacterium]|nr:hypothetical protein [Burkholderiales bacterium]
MANNLFNEFSARCIDLHRMIGKALATVGLTTLIAVSIQAALAQQGDAIEEGRLQFIEKCAVCHGQEGKGDGV